jgi:hypothetical protein
MAPKRTLPAEMALGETPRRAREDDHAAAQPELRAAMGRRAPGLMGASVLMPRFGGDCSESGDGVKPSGHLVVESTSISVAVQCGEP